MNFGLVKLKWRISSEAVYAGLDPETMPPAAITPNHSKGYSIYLSISVTLVFENDRIYKVTPDVQTMARQ